MLTSRMTSWSVAIAMMGVAISIDPSHELLYVHGRASEC